MEQESVQEVMASVPQFLKNFSYTTVYEIAYSRLQGTIHPYDLSAKRDRGTMLEINFNNNRKIWGNLGAYDAAYYKRLERGHAFAREMEQNEFEIDALERIYTASGLNEDLLEAAEEQLAIEISEGGGLIHDGLSGYINKVNGMDPTHHQPLMLKMYENDIGGSTKKGIGPSPFANFLRQPIF